MSAGSLKKVTEVGDKGDKEHETQQTPDVFMIKIYPAGLYLII